MRKIVPDDRRWEDGVRNVQISSVCHFEDRLEDQESVCQPCIGKVLPLRRCVKGGEKRPKSAKTTKKWQFSCFSPPLLVLLRKYIFSHHFSGNVRGFHNYCTTFRSGTQFINRRSIGLLRRVFHAAIRGPCMTRSDTSCRAEENACAPFSR